MRGADIFANSLAITDSGDTFCTHTANTVFTGFSALPLALFSLHLRTNVAETSIATRRTMGRRRFVPAVMFIATAVLVVSSMIGRLAIKGSARDNIGSEHHSHFLYETILGIDSRILLHS